MANAIRYAWEATAAALGLAPRVGRWQAALYATLAGAMPLGLVLGVTLGAVVWMQTRGILERTAGATELLPTVLAVAVVLELAPVGAGLILAARTGASIGAELGSMAVGEQVVALRMLGRSEVAVVAAPKILACMVAAPVLTAVVAAVALGSGYAAESAVGNTNWLRYQYAIFEEVKARDIVLSLGKTIAFGWLIGLIATRTGLLTTGGSVEVGRATTQSVVRSCFAVLIADVVFVALTQ